MKILISIGTLGLGGAEKQAVWLANKLSEQHEVTLLTYQGGAREKDISSRVTWKTIFDNQNEEKITVHDSAKFVVENSGMPFDSGNVDKYDQKHEIDKDFRIGTSGARAFKEKLKRSLEDFPALLQLLTQLYNRFELLLKLFKLIVITLLKVMHKSKQLFVRIVRKIINLGFSLKSKVMSNTRKFLYLISFPKARLNFKNQTYVFRKARKIVKNSSPDLVITFLFHDTLNVGLAGLAQINRPRLIVGRRSPLGYGDGSRNRIHKLILRFIYLLSNLAVSNSQANIESAISDGISKRKIRVIENFVAKNDSSSFLPTKTNPLEVLCIANFHWYKNHESLIQAISTIPNHEKNFRFTFIGDGPLLGSIQQLAFDLKVSSVFRGFVDNPSSEIPAFHALVLVSHVEGSSNALLEGLICGIPALVSKVGAVQELMSQGAPLILCDSDDVSSIANGLIQLKANYEVLSTEAREFSKLLSEALSEDAIFKKWQEAIRRVTS